MKRVIKAFVVLVCMALTWGMVEVASLVVTGNWCAHHGWAAVVAAIWYGNKYLGGRRLDRIEATYQRDPVRMLAFERRGE